MVTCEMTPEITENPEIKSIFDKTEKVPYGGVLCSVFRENTVSASWEVKNGKIYGKAPEGKHGIYIPVMRLEKPYENCEEAYLVIFDGTDDPQEITSQTVNIFAGVQSSEYSTPWIRMFVYWGQRDMNLPSEYCNWLMKVVSDVNTKASQTNISREKKEEVFERWLHRR